MEQRISRELEMKALPTKIDNRGAKEERTRGSLKCETEHGLRTKRLCATLSCNQGGQDGLTLGHAKFEQ